MRGEKRERLTAACRGGRGSGKLAGDGDGRGADSADGEVEEHGDGVPALLEARRGSVVEADGTEIPFPWSLWLDGDRSDGDEHLKNRPWLGRQKVQEFAKISETDWGIWGRRRMAAERNRRG